MIDYKQLMIDAVTKTDICNKSTWRICANWVWCEFIDLAKCLGNVKGNKELEDFFNSEIESLKPALDEIYKSQWLR